MSLHIDQLTSDVIPEPEPAPDYRGGSMEPWETEGQVRAAHARMVRDRLRTRAEGFDD